MYVNSKEILFSVQPATSFCVYLLCVCLHYQLSGADTALPITLFLALTENEQVNMEKYIFKIEKNIKYEWLPTGLENHPHGLEDR